MNSFSCGNLEGQKPSMRLKFGLYSLRGSSSDMDWTRTGAHHVYVQGEAMGLVDNPQSPRFGFLFRVNVNTN